MNKKAQGLSVNTIIIAVIAVTVLVVLVLIFTGVMGEWVEDLRGIRSCISRGGESKPSCDPDEKQILGSFTDVESGQVCCVP